MLISQNLFKHLEHVANSSLKYTLLTSNTKATCETENLLRVSPSIYYRRVGRIASEFGWEEPKLWKKFANSETLLLPQIKIFKLSCGIHKSKKYGIGFIIPYKESINLETINLELTKLFKSHVKKQVREKTFQLYDDKESKSLIILEVSQKSKKETVNYAKSDYAKPSTI